MRSPYGILSLASIFVLSLFLLFYPTHFLIGDEVLYFEQALAWSSGKNTLTTCLPCDSLCASFRPSDYPAGTSLFAALLILLGGSNSVFWLSILCLLAGTWAIGAILNREGNPMIWVAYPWLFAPAIVLTRTLMSDIPGFLLAALFLLFYTSNSKSKTNLFLAGIIAGLGLLFRETNVLWSIPFLLGATIRKTPFHTYLWLGFAIGVVPRLLTGWLFWGSPFFFKDPGIDFSWAALPGNLIFYTFALLILLPGGLWFWLKSQLEYRTEIGICIGLFLLVYSGYSYDAFFKSGYKGLVLQGRYLLPLLPMLTLSAASTNYSIRPWLKSTGLTYAVLLFVGVQFAGHRFNQDQEKVTAALMALPTSTHLSFTFDESHKYLNALHSVSTILDGNALSASKVDCLDTWYVHILTRGESADRRSKSATAEKKVQAFFLDKQQALVFDIKMLDGTRLRVWKTQRLNNDE